MSGFDVEEWRQVADLAYLLDLLDRRGLTTVQRAFVLSALGWWQDPARADAGERGDYYRAWTTAPAEVAARAAARDELERERLDLLAWSERGAR